MWFHRRAVCVPLLLSIFTHGCHAAPPTSRFRSVTPDDLDAYITRNTDRLDLLTASIDSLTTSIETHPVGTHGFGNTPPTLFGLLGSTRARLKTLIPQFPVDQSGVEGGGNALLHLLAAVDDLRGLHADILDDFYTIRYEWSVDILRTNVWKTLDGLTLALLGKFIALGETGHARRLAAVKWLFLYRTAESIPGPTYAVIDTAAKTKLADGVGDLAVAIAEASVEFADAVDQTVGYLNVDLDEGVDLDGKLAGAIGTLTSDLEAIDGYLEVYVTQLGELAQVIAAQEPWDEDADESNEWIPVVDDDDNDNL
ncbi:hypothetical protein TWF696_001495 [Orbilia brochopaga]|uniref:Uncharacterized protein n=1 Tax=Orbilia brochopaga TaxID=3140254 RepID=A0AAV9UCE1_9PEZI